MSSYAVGNVTLADLDDKILEVELEGGRIAKLPFEKISDNLIGVNRTPYSISTLIGKPISGFIEEIDNELIVDNIAYFDSLWAKLSNKYKEGDIVPISYAKRQNPETRCMFVDVEGIYRASIMFSAMGYLKNFNEVLDDIAFKTIDELKGINKAVVRIVDTEKKRFVLTLSNYLHDKDMEKELYKIRTGVSVSAMLASIERPKDNFSRWAAKVMLTPSNIVTIPINEEVAQEIINNKVKAIIVTVDNSIKREGSLFARFCGISDAKPSYFTMLKQLLIARKVIS